MNRHQARLFDIASTLRWIVPPLFAILGLGYIGLEHLLVHDAALTSSYSLLGVLVWGAIVPFLMWLGLTWMARVTRSLQELIFQHRVLVVLKAIGDAAGQSFDLEAILQTALGKTVPLLGLEAGEIRLLEGGNLNLKSHHGIPPELVADQKSIPLAHCSCGHCILTGQVLARADFTCHPTRVGCGWTQAKFRSAVCVPMTVAGQVVGVIQAAGRRQEAFSSQESEILTAIGDRMAMAVKNVQMYEDARRQAARMESVSLIGQRMLSLLDLDSLLAEVVRLVCDRFGYEHCHVLLVDEQTKEAVLKAASGPNAERLKQRGLRIKIGEKGLPGWVARTGQTMLCNELFHDTVPEVSCGPELCPQAQAELTVPLRVGKRIIGVLDVQSDRRGAFGREDVTVLQILGNQLGTAIQNVRLFQKTNRRYEALVALHKTALDVIAQLDMGNLLDALLGRGVKLLGAQAGAIFRYDVEQDLLYNVANYNTSQDWTGVTLRPGEGIIGQVILEEESLFLNGENEADKVEMLIDVPYTAVMGAPLKWQDQIIGGIILLDERQPGSFHRDDLWLLKLFADLASIALKNAELHMKVRAFSADLEQKVQERSYELVVAKEEISAQATQLRALLARTMHLQEEERERIARDMHDGVVQLVTAARYELKATKVAVETGSATAIQKKFAATREVMDEIEREIRHAIYNLTPPILDAVGVVPVLENYVANFADLTGMMAHVQVTGVPVRLSSSTEVAIFRLVEQALQNVATHAEAQKASVSMAFRPSLLRVTIQDDGRGFDYEGWAHSHNGEHLGLLGMQERVSSLNGTMEISTTPGHGTCITFDLPVQATGSSD